MNAIRAEQLAHLAEKIAFISEVLPPEGEPASPTLRAPALCWKTWPQSWNACGMK